MTDIVGQVVVKFSGELEDPDAVRAQIEQASCAYTVGLQVDLTDVTYFPSTVVGVLFGALKSANAAGINLQVKVAAGSVVHNIVLVTAMPHVAM